MSKPDWTPGPWKPYYAKNGNLLGIGVDRPNDDDHAIGVTDYQFGLWGSGKERVANARLIAATPELAKEGHALVMLCLQSDRYRDDAEFRDAVDAFIDAERKAGHPAFSRAAGHPDYQEGGE